MRAGRVLFLFVLVGPLRDLAEASEWLRSAPAFHEEAGRTWEGLKQRLEDWGLYLRDHFDFPTVATERPLITFMLSQSEKLALTSGQVKSLEGLRDAFRRQAIRSEADLKVAEMDLSALLQADPVDLGKVEIKVREIE